MFSLIITIISIALVAALALATLYYGGQSFTKSDVQAQAAKVHVQAQQVLGAAELYRADHGRWPMSLETLTQPDEQGRVYLKAIPSGVTEIQAANFVTHAVAQATKPGWVTPVEAYPTYVMGSSVSDAVCAEINVKSFGLRGILTSARSAFSVQCYRTAATTGVLGEVAPNVVVITRDAKSVQNVLPPAELVEGGELPPADSPDWYMKPTGAPVAGGGGQVDVNPSTASSSTCSSGPYVYPSTGDIFGVTISGPDAIKEFSNPSMPSSIGMLEGTENLSEYIDGVPGVVVFGTLNPAAPGNLAVTITGSSGKTVTCNFVIEDSQVSTTINEVSLTPTNIPEESPVFVTATATDGEFAIVNGRKPNIVINFKYEVPAADIELVSSTELKFKAPTLLQAGLSPIGADQTALVQMANYGTPSSVPVAYGQLTYTPSLGNTSWQLQRLNGFTPEVGMTLSSTDARTHAVEIGAPSKFTALIARNSGAQKTGLLALSGNALRFGSLSSSGMTAAQISSLNAALSANTVGYCVDNQQLAPGQSCAFVVKSEATCSTSGPISDLSGLTLRVNTVGCPGAGLELLDVPYTGWQDDYDLLNVGYNFGTGAGNLPLNGEKTVSLRVRNKGYFPVEIAVHTENLDAFAQEDGFNDFGYLAYTFGQQGKTLLQTSNNCNSVVPAYGICTLTMKVNFPKSLYVNAPGIEQRYGKAVVVEGKEVAASNYYGQALNFTLGWTVANNTYPSITDNMARRVVTNAVNMGLGELANETSQATISNHGDVPVKVNLSIQGDGATLDPKTCAEPIPAKGTCGYSYFMPKATRNGAIGYYVPMPYADYTHATPYWLSTPLVRD